MICLKKMILLKSLEEIVYLTISDISEVYFSVIYNL
jgi:hypothetical protein